MTRRSSGKLAENLELNEQYIESVLDRGFTVNYPYTFRRSFSTQMNALNPATTILAEQHKIIRLLGRKGRLCHRRQRCGNYSS